MKTKTDFKVLNCFSLLILYPLSRRANEWIEDNVWIENWQNDGRIAIEPRFFDAIYLEIINDNLTIEKV